MMDHIEYVLLLLVQNLIKHMEKVRTLYYT